MDLRREKDIEQLRRVALAQQVQIEQLLRVLRSQSDELAKLKGNEGELQEKLTLIETLSRQAGEVIERLHRSSTPVQRHQAGEEAGDVDGVEHHEKQHRLHAGGPPGLRQAASVRRHPSGVATFDLQVHDEAVGVAANHAMGQAVDILNR